jgi:FkbM family methyltransferase
MALDPRPLPAPLRPIGRFALRLWSRFPKAPGYLYQIVERWGARLASHPIDCRLFTGARLSCDLGDDVQRHIYFFGAYEPIEAQLFTFLLKPGMVVVDAGAHVGQYSLIAAKSVGPDGEVHAFEPVPATFARLEAHVTANGFASTVRLNRTALWRGNDELTVSLPLGEPKNSGAYTAAPLLSAIDRVSAPGVALDDYVERRGLRRLDVVKMDIEGAELFALEGATRSIARWHPVLLMEINEVACRRMGYEPARLWEHLAPYGYRMWALGQGPESCRVLDDLDGIHRADVIFHTQALPLTMTRGWSLKGILRSHRRLAGLR